jgi:uncharacterized membrane protein YagU involved in acid resistance
MENKGNMDNGEMRIRRLELLFEMRKRGAKAMFNGFILMLIFAVAFGLVVGLVAASGNEVVLMVAAVCGLAAGLAILVMILGGIYKMAYPEKSIQKLQKKTGEYYGF